jgi:hypothetical protein
MADSLKTPPKPHKIAASAVAPSRFTSWREHLAAERRWFAETFARDKMVDMLRQLAWVVPLTLLIWIYAEREQITRQQNETIPFELVNSDSARLVTLRPPQDSNLVVELEGPRARVLDVLQRLRGGEFPRGLRIEVDRSLELNREHQLPTMSLIANNDLFRRNGITVTRTQPDRISVIVDQMVERDARIEPVPGTANLAEGTKFDPPMVKVRGPLNLLQPANDPTPKPLVVYAQLPEDVLTKPGTHDVQDVTLTLPPNLREIRGIALLTPKVNATLQVRAADARIEQFPMPIRLDTPKGLLDKFTVTDVSLPGVTLIGPKDAINRLQDPNFEPKPYALLRIDTDDANGRVRRSRRLRFVDLPPGVHVSDADLNREVTFQVVPKADAEQ